MKKYFTPTTILIGLVILAAALFRISRHVGWIDLPPNVAPISALALFGGALLPRRLMFVLPLATMLLSDLIIGFYALPVMVSVYACFALSNLLGIKLRTKRTFSRTVSLTLLGSTIFFLVTNGAVWLADGMYPMTLAGLGQAYVAGLPFFRNTVLGDLGFAALFFGAYQAVVVYWRQRQADVSVTMHG